MDTNEIFVQQGEVLQKVVPALIGIHWPTYGRKFSLHDDAGKLKYQGVMRRCYPRGMPGTSLTVSLGELPDETKSFGVLGNKLDALALNPGSLTSMGLRKPPEVWGGAIRNRLGISGITGLPEIGDHLTEVHLSWYTEQLTQEKYDGMTYGDHQCVIEARKLVGMTLTEWLRLSLKIADIIHNACL